MVDLEEVMGMSSVEASKTLPALEASSLVALEHSGIAVDSKQAIVSYRFWSKM